MTKKIKVGMLVFPNVEELDFLGPWEMISMLSQFVEGVEYFTVSTGENPVTCAKGHRFLPDYTIADCPAMDYLIVPGGRGQRDLVDNQTVRDFIKNTYQNGQGILSVCSGTFLLHAAGLLKGKKATTHWRALDRLRAFGDVEVVESRFVVDGNIWSSSGVSAGLDMTLAFIAQIWGEEAAGKTQLESEYFADTKVYGSAALDEKVPRYIRDLHLNPLAT